MKLNEEKIVNFLKENVGEYISTRELVIETGACEGVPTDEEWMEIHDKIMRVAGENGFAFDFSEWYGQIVGLPYNLDGIIERQNCVPEGATVSRCYDDLEEDLIYRDTTKGYYFPSKQIISVYDKEKDNLVIEIGMDYPGNTFKPEKETYTLSRRTLNSIKKNILNSGVLDITSFEKVEYAVQDGENNSFYFCADGQKKLIECDNFYMLYGDYTKESNAGKVKKLVDKIEDILDREKGNSK